MAIEDMHWLTEWDRNEEHSGNVGFSLPEGDWIEASHGGFFYNGAQSARELPRGNEVIEWYSRCGCGWRGPVWERVIDPAKEDRAARRAYSADGSIPKTLLGNLFEEWAEHAQPETLKSSLREMSFEIKRIQGLRDSAVEIARDLGLSWAEIGKSTKMTRQSAQERWGKKNK